MKKDVLIVRMRYGELTGYEMKDKADGWRRMHGDEFYVIVLFDDSFKDTTFDVIERGNKLK